ncbi:MAG: ATP-grasp domain-containing protein [Phycisphaerae bacterium]|nr:ATP-grasp domain-containing protein [Phycisphaerae bacterium]
MSRSKSTSRAGLRVLLSCVGRRVELIQAFRAAAKRLRCPLELHGTDVSDLAPGMHQVDRAHRVLPIAHRRYIPELIDLARSRRIDMLVPTIDTELLLLADARERFARCGCTALVSTPEVINIGRDKLLTHDALAGAGIDTPMTWPIEEILSRRCRHFPYQIKPRYGSAGLGNYRADDLETLRFWAKRVPDSVVQEFVPGTEYTLDVYAGLDGRVRCVVPRRRLEIRSGEVQKSRIVKDPQLIEIGKRVVESIGDCIGVITVQCIRTPQKQIRVIEINPRFGGGAPLSIHAGADFPRWLMAERLGKRPRITLDGYRDGVRMLRYDQSVFLG